MSDHDKTSLESSTVPGAAPLKRLALRREAVAKLEVRTGVRTGTGFSAPPGFSSFTGVIHPVPD